MAKRGRESVDAVDTRSRLSVVPFVAPMVEAPECLTETEAAVFRDTAAAMPAGWFKADSLPLLVEYSRAVDVCNRLAAMREMPDMSLKDLAVLLAAHEKQARLVISLATKMRLTQQSRILPDQAGRDVKNKPVAAPPWSGAAVKTGARRETSNG